jgi:hypothetical protein
LTIEIAKVVAATLARFAKAEKPQLSPRVGASFTKNRRQISGIRLNGAGRFAASVQTRGNPGPAVALGFVGFLNRTRVRKTRAAVAPGDIECAPIRRYDAAQIPGRTWFQRFGFRLERHNSATGSRSRAGEFNASSSQQATEARRITGPCPAEELGIGWRFFPTYTLV